MAQGRRARGTACRPLPPRDQRADTRQAAVEHHRRVGAPASPCATSNARRGAETAAARPQRKRAACWSGRLLLQKAAVRGCPRPARMIFAASVTSFVTSEQ